MDRLRRADGGAADGITVLGRVEQPGQHVDAAVVDFGRLRVLVRVDEVPAERLGHQHVGFWLHPGGDEAGEVERRVAVEVQLVVDDLVGRARRHLPGRQLVAGDRVAQVAGAVHRRERGVGVYIRGGELPGEHCYLLGLKMLGLADAATALGPGSSKRDGVMSSGAPDGHQRAGGLGLGSSVCAWSSRARISVRSLFIAAALWVCAAVM